VLEGEHVRITRGLLAGLIHQLPNGKVGQEKAIDLLHDQIGAARAEHQPLAGHRHLDFGQHPFVFPALV
jgi:hypothetical protein